MIARVAGRPIADGIWGGVALAVEVTAGAIRRRPRRTKLVLAGGLRRILMPMRSSFGNAANWRKNNVESSESDAVSQHVTWAARRQGSIVTGSQRPLPINQRT